MSYGVGRRHDSDPALLWLWRRPAATAPIRPLAWESPYAARGSGPINGKKTKKKRERAREREMNVFLHFKLNLLSYSLCNLVW